MTQPAQTATTLHNRTRNKRMNPTFPRFSPLGRLAAMIALGLVGSLALIVRHADDWHRHYEGAT